MRGKGKNGSACRQISGITPAYAGKRDSWNLSYHLTGDHPRLCGEKVYNMKKVYR